MRRSLRLMSVMAATMVAICQSFTTTIPSTRSSSCHSPFTTSMNHRCHQMYPALSRRSRIEFNRLYSGSGLNGDSSSSSREPTTSTAVNGSSTTAATTTTTTTTSEQRRQEMLLEQMSLLGANKIAALNIPERAKRAMLAEAIEDRIFLMSEELEQLSQPNNADDGTVTIPEANRETAIEYAKEIKSLRGQYEELVSGGPSSLLSTLENALFGEDTDSSDDESAAEPE